MRVSAFTLLLFALTSVSCRPSAAPVSISNRPITVNGVPQTNLPLPPMKNIERLGWTTFEGREVKISDLKGKVIVLDFWATYCPPCLEGIPHLVERQNNNPDLQVVGLHVGGDEDRAKVPPFVEKLKINYSLAYPEDDLTEALTGGNSAIPQTFVFDRNGKLIKRFIGFDETIKADLDAAVKQALN